MTRLRDLVHEIHRRSLWQVLGVYLVGGWVAYEVILGLTEGGLLPEWFPGVAVGLLIVGLPIVLATAIVQEGLPGASSGQEHALPQPQPPAGSDHEDAPPTGSARPSSSGTALDRLLTWRRAIAAGVFVFVVAFLLAGTAMILGGGEAGRGASDRSIAVLPLENMSPDPDDAYFTDGIHEEIITHLFRIGDLRTVARATVMDLAGTDRSLPEVADALGVAYLLVGSVRREGETSRVSVSLVEPRTGEQLWADSYQVTGTDVFGVQVSIAENVAGALEAELSPDAHARLAAQPTTSAAAYDDYLRALERLNRSYGSDDTEAAIRLLERAVAADPEFALAHAALGTAHAQDYWFHYDHTESRLDRARRHIDRALSIDPELPQAHLAMAQYHYWGRLAYDDALRELDIAAAGLPGDPEIRIVRGAVHRRAGDMDRAIEAFRRATEIDPRNWRPWWNLAETYALVRRFDDALATAGSGWEASDQLIRFWRLKAQVRLKGHAGPEAALATLDSIPDAGGLLELSDEARVQRMAREYLLRADAWSYLRRFDLALDALTGPGDVVKRSQFVLRPLTLARAMIHRHAGDHAAARATFDSARVFLEPELERQPEDVRILGALAIALAGLGRHDEALELADRALALLPPEREAWRGMSRVYEMAVVQTMTGRHDAAVKSLDALLSRPSQLTVRALELDPTWDPLRELPAFRVLLNRYGEGG